MDNSGEPMLLDVSQIGAVVRAISEPSPEIIMAFVGAVGVKLKNAEDFAAEKLVEFGYEVVRIRVTTDVLPRFDKRASSRFEDDFTRLWTMMDIGTAARRKHGNDIIALGIAAEITKRRPGKNPRSKTAYIVHSLKHPEEVRRLRALYPHGFYLIGVHSPPNSRRKFLCSLKGIGKPEAKRLMDRDHRENGDFGQQLIDTFHLSDFFAGWEENDDESAQAKSHTLLRNTLVRFVEIMFGHPYRTPTFDEYAMFLAFSTALRSADLSRQVGAVIARDGAIIGVGANDCPCAGGGLYWPMLNAHALKFSDFPDGRDWTRSGDSNRKEQIELVQQVVEIVGREMANEVGNHLRQKVTLDVIQDLEQKLLKKLGRVLLTNSRIADLTEFGRIVHAEMEALLSCGRTGVSTVGATLYSTTFPCHNCAKHIIAAGIRRVVFIEPYLKSRAMKFHNEAIEIVYPGVNSKVSHIERAEAPTKVRFEPFYGVGPRKFFDLFSMDIGAGYPLIRKDKPSGGIKLWSPKEANVRVQMTCDNYLERELKAARAFEEITLNSKPKI